MSDTSYASGEIWFVECYMGVLPWTSRERESRRPAGLYRTLEAVFSKRNSYRCLVCGDYNSQSTSPARTITFYTPRVGVHSFVRFGRFRHLPPQPEQCENEATARDHVFLSTSIFHTFISHLSHSSLCNDRVPHHKKQFKTS